MTVVVGYTPDERGVAALERAVAEARLRGSRLVVVNATRGDALVDPHHAGGAAVDALERRLDGLDVAHEVRRPIGPDVADAVLDAVEETGAELLVIGLRRRSAVGKLLMGSVAQRLILGCPCPVLGVKATGAEAAH